MSIVLIDIETSFVTITLNQPDRLNALSPSMINALHAALGQAMGDGNARVIVLNGAGEQAFCVGHNLLDSLELSSAETRKAADQLQDITRMILFGAKLVIGRVNGWAIGAGFELAMNCHFSIWSSTAGGILAERALEMGISGASTPRAPWHDADPVVRLDEWQTARSLHEAGLVHAVARPEQLPMQIRRLAFCLSALDPAAVAGLKQARFEMQRARIDKFPHGRNHPVNHPADLDIPEAQAWT